MIYIHVPFCKSFCTYCGFYSELCRSGDSPEVQKFLSGLKREICRRRPEIDAARAVSPHSLYIGGGTPSILSVADMADIVETLGYCGYEELTIEVNPDDIVKNGKGYVTDLLSLGVNRISMGVQSMDDGVLRWMNRRHNATEAVEAYDIIRSAGVRNVSLDLIFGISLMSDGQWADSVGRVVALHPEHISAYQLSVEDDSALGRMVREGKYSEASDDFCRKQYDYLCNILRDAGYEHYEISNFALPGRRALHNSAYWKRTPYVGLGPGAHSFDGKTRSWNSDEIDYKAGFEILSEIESREETIMLGLRTSDGLDESLLPDSPERRRLISEGSLEISEGKVRIPETQFFVSDNIISQLI